MNHIEMMQLAEAEAAKSVCKRAQVGAVVVTVMGKVHTGWNLNAHEPSGCCEDENGRTRILCGACIVMKSIIRIRRPKGLLSGLKQRQGW